MKTTLIAVVICLWGLLLDAQVSFNLSSTVAAGNDPNSIAAADVNGDGKVDMIVANYYDNSLSVLTNNGSGGFVLAGTYAVGSGPLTVVAADVNGDGKVDAICENSDSSSVSVLTNDGSGGFVLSGTYTVGNGPLWITAADVNGDGKPDLITANWNSNTGNTLTVLTNDGSGGFVLASSPVVGNGPASVMAADVNGDGKVDLISANWADSTLTVLTNNGSGGFVLSGTYAVGNGPYTVTAADVNGDGKVDLISANWNNSAGNTLTVLTNNGSGGFVFSSTLTVGSGALFVAAADVNGDGALDLISANYNDNTLSILTNNGSGGFVFAANLSVGGHPNAVTAADVNGDGKLDLLIPSYPDNVVSVFTNATTFPLVTPPPPVADATATEPIVISANGSNAAVVLNGSKSYDLDGDSLQYTWLAGSNNVIATGALAIVTLPVGANSITLTVSDGTSSNSQTITITVLTISQAIDLLIATVNQDVLKAQSLVPFLRAALASIDKSNPISAVSQLRAFQYKVKVQLGPINPALAQSLYNDAQAIIDAIGGERKKVKVQADKATDKLHLNFAGSSRPDLHH